MTDPKDVLKTQGEHGARLTNLEHGNHRLFERTDDHKESIAKINANLDRIHEEGKGQLESQRDLMEQVRRIKEEQIRCQATRQEQTTAGAQKTSKAARIGGWAALGMLVYVVLDSAAQKLMVYIKAAAAGTVP